MKIRAFFHNIAKTKHEKILLLAILVYFAVFSVVTVLKYYYLKTFAYDLGIYNQTLFSTLQGKLLYETPDLSANPTGSMFGIHFAPILLLIVPLYSIVPSPITLLALQSAGIALAAYPIFRLAQCWNISSNLSLAFAISYLLNPVVQGVNWYDFHPEAFIPVFVLFAIYFFQKKLWTPYIISILLALTCIETVAFMLLFFGLVAIFSLAFSRRLSLKQYFHIHEFLFAFGTIILCAAWYLVGLLIIKTFNPVNLYVTSGADYWTVLGAKSLLDIPIASVRHPGNVIAALDFGLSGKIVYLLILFAPVGFLCFFAPRWLLMTIPWLATSLLSNNPPFYQIGLQYPTFVIPFVYVAGVAGYSLNSKKLVFATKWTKRIGKNLIPIVLVFSFLASPLIHSPLAAYSSVPYGIPEDSYHINMIHTLMAMIPPTASVLTDQKLFPPLSNRLDAYLVPTSAFFPKGTSFNNTLNSFIDKVDFVLLDLAAPTVDPFLVLENSRVSTNFGVYASADGAILLRRGYVDKPVLFMPYHKTFTYSDLVLAHGSNYYDPLLKGTKVISSGIQQGSDFWYGPYTILPPGTYSARYLMRTIGTSTSGNITLPIDYFATKISESETGNKSIGYHVRFDFAETKSKILLLSSTENLDLLRSDEYTYVQLNFTVDHLGVYEFPGMNVNTNSPVLISSITVLQLTASDRLVPS
jgi:uncharacterized membrane protein